MKTRLILFMLAAAFFNVVVTGISFLIFLLLYSTLLVSRIPAEKAFIGPIVSLVASFILSFFVYRRVLKLFLKKFPAAILPV